MYKRQLIVIGIVLFSAVVLFTITSFRQEAQTNKSQKKQDDAIADINAPEPKNIEEKEIRKQRGKKYKTRVPLDKMEDQPAVFDIPESHSEVEPAFPVEQSDLIIIGTITDSQAFVSNDKTAVYSEFQVSVNQILKNNNVLPIIPESNIVAERIGGNVRFPSGRIQRRGYSGHNLPQKNKQYVLFLKWDEAGKDYSILTGYEVQEQTVNPLDGLDNENPRIFSNYKQYKNADLSMFLSKLKEVIENLSVGGK